MKKLPFVIGTATAYAAFYQMAPFMGVPDSVMLLLYLLSPLVMAGMVLGIVKHGTPSAHTFDDRFYEDLDCRPIRAGEPQLVRVAAAGK